MPAGRARTIPVVVYVHGNGWAYRTHDDIWYTPYLATHGFFAVSIDHRLSAPGDYLTKS